MFLRQNASARPAAAGDDDPAAAAPMLQRSGADVTVVRPRAAEPAGPEAPPDLPAVPPPVVIGPSGTRRAAETEEANGKRLIVGDGIRFKGEITACDRLVVEGHVEATLNETRTLEIRPSGRFIGGCEVEEAEVSGLYEGDLTVLGRLTVRASGRLTGRIQYGELELERGGRIAGELSVRDAGGPEPEHMLGTGSLHSGDAA